ncbi:MAG: hypothetical protein IJ024_01805 [Lachnospiraceae bacterium]|nr:hypothetical protein [Lachnospiraceae bacterium]
MKKILTTVTAVLVAVTLVIILKNQFGSIFAGNTYGMPAAIEKGEIDHLFIGSSMFRQGLDIDVLEENLDGSVYILSYNGNQPVFMAKELEYMLERGLKIENLYIDFYAYTLTAIPWISDTKMFLDTDFAFKLDAWKTMAAHNDVSLNDFYEMFVTANNEQILMYPINNAIVSSQFRNGGSLMVPAGKTKEHLDTLDLGVRDGLFESQLKGYDKILELAEEHGINLLFIETPKYEKLLTDTRDGSYSELLEEMTAWAENKNAPYLLAQSFDFDHGDGANFQDLIHLSGQGRKVYCEMLAEYIVK